MTVNMGFLARRHDIEACKSITVSNELESGKVVMRVYKRKKDV